MSVLKAHCLHANPHADRAIVSRKKVHDYLLNRDHPDGGSKAIWFDSCGYQQQHWQLLANDLLAIAMSCDQFDTDRTPYGIKYIATGELSRPGYRKAMVRTVWIIEENDIPRLVTAYPDPKL